MLQIIQKTEVRRASTSVKAEWDAVKSLPIAERNKEERRIRRELASKVAESYYLEVDGIRVKVNANKARFMSDIRAAEIVAESPYVEG